MDRYEHVPDAGTSPAHSVAPILLLLLPWGTSSSSCAVLPAAPLPAPLHVVVHRRRYPFRVVVPLGRERVGVMGGRVMGGEKEPNPIPTNRTEASIANRRLGPDCQWLSFPEYRP